MNHILAQENNMESWYSSIDGSGLGDHVKHNHLPAGNSRPVTLPSIYY